MKNTTLLKFLQIENTWTQRYSRYSLELMGMAYVLPCSPDLEKIGKMGSFLLGNFVIWREKVKK